ncbi:MAG: hypothetical protein RJA70_303 [Pseudomonadota bacterium]|jgi:hypothetical protein
MYLLSGGSSTEGALLDGFLAGSAGITRRFWVERCAATYLAGSRDP